FVAKLNPTGTARLFSSYLGGNGNDYGTAIRLTAAGGVALTGSTASTNFPSTSTMPAYPDQSYSDVFVTTFNTIDGTLRWSSQFGGSGGERGNALAEQQSRELVIAGQTGGGYYGFPIINGFQSTFGGGSDAFVAKVA